VRLVLLAIVRLTANVLRASHSVDHDGARRCVMSKQTIIVEIRAAEGGDDAKLLVQEQFRIYGRVCTRRRL